ncbi:MAG: YeiH family protein [Alistipes sp.]
MKNFLKKFLVEDWVVTVMSIPLLILAGVAAYLPGHGPKVPSNLLTGEAWINIGVLFVIAIVILYIGNRLLSRPLRGLLASFTVIFIIALLAQWIAKIQIIKAFGFEAVFFSVILGLVVRNCFRIPDWLKPAIQGEFFIKIGVVCLGATILFRDVMRSGSMGLLQAIIVVTIVWLTAFFIARRMKVDDRSAMTLASGVSICGVSACITAARVANTDDKKLSYIVSIVLIIVVPMIYLMPFLARLIVPLLTDNVAVQNEIIGAWIGGTIDTTSGVTASSGLFENNDAVQNTAVIVKATQNVLIGVVAFFIALYLSTKGENGQSQRPSIGIVWEKFPKFILGFVVASLVFSLCQSYDVFEPYKVTETTGAIKLYETDLAKTFSTFFFSLAFVCIGLDTRLKDIVSKENRNVLYAFLSAQGLNIIVTLAVAYLLFGVIKPIVA